MKSRLNWALSPNQRSDARAALALLSGSGITLEQAAIKALDGKRALNQVSVDDACTIFLRGKTDVRPKTFEWYETELGHIRARFGRMKLDDLDRPTFDRWLSTLTRQREPLVRAMRVLLRWAIVQPHPMASRDITQGMAAMPSHKGKGNAAFLSVEDTKRVLYSMGDDAPAMALAFFAGIRPHELWGAGKTPLPPSAIDREGRTIRVGGDISKTGAPRVIEGIPDTVWAWLPSNPETNLVRITSASLFAKASAALGKRWPHDATRHSFATYALALTANPGQVSVWLGHEGAPTLLHRHYRGLTTKAEAERYFAIRPVVGR